MAQQGPSLVVPNLRTDQPFERAGPTLVLASASPRRRELLAALGAEYQAIATDAEERTDRDPPDLALVLPPSGLPAAQHPARLAWRKASAAAAHAPDALVLGADTVVVLDGDLLNKPRDTAHAREMLGRLSGRTHSVYTGLCVIRPHGQPALFDLVASEVEFVPLSSAAIDAYVLTGEPLDKAGAYGLQGLGGQMVRQVRGSYTNVVGLPLLAVHRLLGVAGATGLRDPAETYQHWLLSQGKELPPCPPTLP